MLGIVVANMVRAIRTISIERGHDPRGFALMPFGGAGPLHARDVAVALGLSEILVPPAPGIVCAQGLVVSDIKEDFVASHRTEVQSASDEAVRELVSGLLEQAAGWFEAEEIPADARTLELSFDMRYIGQNFELAVPVATIAALAARDLPAAEALRDMFFEVHDRAYGYHNPDDPVEVVNFRLTARGHLFKEPGASTGNGTPPAPEPFETRPVFFTDPETPVDTPVYDRARLLSGQIIDGPAIIEQLDATTPVYPHDLARVDDAGNTVIEVRP
jgi:N-methylhydantoinase A